ncbi:alpha/beta hydrolase [Nocardioides korecus]
MTTPVPHPDVAALVAQFAELGVPTYDQVGVLHARALCDGVTRLQRPPTEVADVHDVLLPGDAGLLPARVYHPHPGEARTVVLYLHGGGWTLGGIKPADRPCRALAAASGCVVVSLDYRRAPETKFPGPLLDCLAAARALATDPGLVGGAWGGLVLLGDSAGGNLAAATALELRADPADVRAQVLLYPSLLPARGTPYASYVRQADGPLMSAREMVWFWDHYLRTADDARDPRAAPLLAEDLTGLPPTTIVTAELDPLRDEALAYAERLATSGVPVTTTTYAGAAHGFWWMDAVMTQAAELTAQLARVVAESPSRT